MTLRRRIQEFVPGKFGYAPGILNPPRSLRCPREKAKVDIKSAVLPPSKPRIPTTEKQAYRTQMAELRRAYLPEGYEARKQSIAKANAVARRKNNIFAGQVPIDFPKDEHLTLPSISQLLADERKIQTPKRLVEIQSQKNKNRRTFNDKKYKQVLQNIFDLYHSAGSFCVTPEQIKKAVNHEFTEVQPGSPLLSMSALVDELDTTPVLFDKSVRSIQMERKNRKVENIIRVTAGNGEVGLREMRIAKAVWAGRIQIPIQDQQSEQA